jgi:hypothetical protein
MILNLLHPNKDWVYRYYQGTDPIASDTGNSKMASVIWDEQIHAPCAIMNFREDNNPKKSFLQSLLLGLYYGTTGLSEVKELVEKNIGLAYISYVEAHGFWRRQMLNSELPEYFRSGDEGNIGIDNKGNRSSLLINKMSELYNTYGDNIYFPVILEQLKTFACRITRSGNETWGTLDTRYYDDDVLYALVFAYMAACSFNTYKTPKLLSEESKPRYEYRLEYDTSWNQVRRRVRV